MSLRGIFVKRFAGEAFDDFAEQDEAEIGVLDLLTGLMDQRLGHHAREDGIMSLRILIEIAMSREAGIVQQQHADGDARAPGGIGIGFCSRGPFGQKPRDEGASRSSSPLLDEHHHGSGCDDRLRERGHVVNRVRRYGRQLWGHA